MDIKSLNYFMQAAETLNFTKAAKNCFVTQTAISIAIARMEEELGFQLFKRNNRAMRLTSAGHEFYKWTVQTLNSYQRIVDAGKSIAAGRIGTLNLGIASVFDGLWLHDKLKDYDEQLGQVTISERIYPGYDMLDMLKSRDIDAFFGSPFEFQDNPEVITNTITHFNWVLILRKDHSLTEYESIPSSRLSAESCCMLSCQGCPQTEAYLYQQLYEQHLPFLEISQFGSSEEIMLYCINNNQMALMPSFVVPYLNDFLTWRSIENCSLLVPYAFIYLKIANHPIINSLNYIFKHDLPNPAM